MPANARRVCATETNAPCRCANAGSGRPTRSALACPTPRTHATPHRSLTRSGSSAVIGTSIGKRRATGDICLSGKRRVVSGARRARHGLRHQPGATFEGHSSLLPGCTRATRGSRTPDLAPRAHALYRHRCGRPRRKRRAPVHTERRLQISGASRCCALKPGNGQTCTGKPVFENTTRAKRDSFSATTRRR